MKYYALFALTLLAGCGTLGFGGKQEQPPVAPVATAKPMENCPEISVRDGAGLYQLNGGKENTPLTLRYQASITQVARECFAEGGNLRIKIGVEGRVVVGPLGGAGTLSLPIRLAMTKNINDPVWSKFFTVPVAIPANTPHVLFVQVSESDLIIPMPSEDELSRMEIVVGFDPKGSLSSPKKKR